MIDLSIIITIDKKNNLEKCLNSIINQSYYNNCEIILVDENKEISSKFLSKFDSEKIKYFSDNSYLTKIKGKYIFPITSSSYLEKNALNCFWKLKEKKDYDIIFTDYYEEYNTRKKRKYVKSFTELKEDKFFLEQESPNIIFKNTLLKKYKNFSSCLKNCSSIGKLDKFVITTIVYEKNSNFRVKILNNKFIILGFLLIFLCGLFCLKNVGSYFDEDSEKDILRMNIISYSEKLKIKRSYALRLREMGLKPITESVERDHGIAPYYLYTLFLLIKDANISSYLWHFYTFIICFLGTIALYFILKNILKNKYLSLLLTAVFFFSPRIFADSLYNNKDMILLAFLMMSFYFTIETIKNKNYKNAFILGILCAFMCNVKVLGFYFVGILGLAYIIDMIFNKQFTKRNILVCLVAFLSWLSIYILITPAIWCGETFDLIGHIKWGLEQSTNFSRLVPKVRFEGIIYKRDVNPLPWYYLPKMMIITTPIIVILLFLTSLILIIKDLVIAISKKKISNSLKIVILAIFIFIVPFSIAIFSKPNIYNGWRHFYFLYGILIIIMSYSLHGLKKYIKLNFMIKSLLVITLIYYLIGNLINGVGGMSYYNFLVNNNRNLKYETDYYGVMTKEALNNILKIYPKGKVYIYSKENTSASASLFTTVWKLPRNKEKRIKLISTEEEYQQLKNSKKQVLYFYNTNYNFKEEIKNLKKIYTNKHWYTIINQFYE